MSVQVALGREGKTRRFAIVCLHVDILEKILCFVLKWAENCITS